jgi:soluble lytic murein transglycosylase-like protein
VAGHRSPSGRRAYQTNGPVSATQLIARSKAPAAPRLRTSVLASAAAVGAVATGTFSTLVPALSDAAPTAAADEAHINTALAASTVALPTVADLGSPSLVPVKYAMSSDGFAAADTHLAMLGKGADLAKQAADQLAKEQAAQAEKQRLDNLISRGGVDSWVAQALDVLDLPQDLAPSVKKIIMKESGGNPRAINNWDSNARSGNPSQGLMQTIPSTFHHYVAPSLSDKPITDPVANITAGVSYMIDQYGIDTLEAGGRTNSSGDYVGY